MKQKQIPGPKASQICTVKVHAFKLGLRLTETLVVNMIHISSP